LVRPFLNQGECRRDTEFRRQPAKRDGDLIASLAAKDRVGHRRMRQILRECDLRVPAAQMVDRKIRGNAARPRAE
jgi:hypothetical protein